MCEVDKTLYMYVFYYILFETVKAQLKQYGNFSQNEYISSNIIQLYLNGY